MICAIRGSLCVVQIVIKKPSKEICDLKRVFYPGTWLMSLSSVICYQLTCLFSNQERRQTKVSEPDMRTSNNRWQCATTQGGQQWLQVVWIQSWQRKAWGCSADLIRQKQILTCSFLSCLPSISLQSVWEKTLYGPIVTLTVSTERNHTFIVKSHVLRPCFTPPRGNHYSR